MDIFDYNDHRKDSELGTASVDLAPLREDAELLDANSTILLSGRPRGTVGYDLRYFPVLKAEKQEDGTEEPLPESSKMTMRWSWHAQAHAMELISCPSPFLRDRHCAHHASSS